MCGQIANDGTFGIWAGQRVQIAGLTPGEAVSRIRVALLTNYIGIFFQKVSVMKVQQVTAPNDRQ
jgi:predicted RNA-binding Zn-ribbon protein involved in translation (DUF1610 family)